MSMLTRKGTVVGIRRGSLRGSRRSHRSIKSVTSAASGSFRIKTAKDTSNYELGEQSKCEENPKVKYLADIIMSFDDARHLVRPSVAGDYQMRADTQPDYGSFLYEIREADNESENIIEFCCKTSNIICNSLVVTVFVGLSIAIPVAMVSIGVKNLEDCPKEPRIPIYLLVGGCFGIIKLLSTLWRNIQIRRFEDMDTEFGDSDSDEAFANKTYRTMDKLLFLFLVCWQVAGTYWTLIIWTPPFKQTLHEPSNWCDKTVYMFTFVQLCGTYSVMLVYVVILCSIVSTKRCCYS